MSATIQQAPQAQVKAPEMTRAEMEAEIARLQAERDERNAEFKAIKAAKAAALQYELTTYETPDGKSVPMIQFSGVCKPKQISQNLCRQILANAEALKAFLPKA